MICCGRISKSLGMISLLLPLSSFFFMLCEKPMIHDIYFFVNRKLREGLEQHYPEPSDLSNTTADFEQKILSSARSSSSQPFFFSLFIETVRYTEKSGNLLVKKSMFMTLISLVSQLKMLISLLSQVVLSFPTKKKKVFLNSFQM